MFSHAFTYRYLSLASRGIMGALLIFILVAWSPMVNVAVLPSLVIYEEEAESQLFSAKTNQITIQRPVLRATITANRIQLRGSNFRPGHVFFVKVTGRGSNSWIKVGTIRPNSNGSIQASVRMPSQLKKALRVRVCLKEVYRGYLVCTTARNY